MWPYLSLLVGRGSIEELRTLSNEHGGLRVGIDVIGGIAGLLCAMLLDAGIEVVHVPGLAVNRARQGTTGGEHKSDPRDAAVIADQVRHRRDLRQVSALSELDGNKTLKRVFFQSAFCSLNHPASRAFYTRKRAEHKTHHQAVIFLARRRIDVLHAMLRNRTAYKHEITQAA